MWAGKPGGEGGGGCQGTRDQVGGSRRRRGGRSLGPLPRPASTSAHDPKQGTLGVCEGLFDSFREQLRPAKHKWGHHRGPSRPPGMAQLSPPWASVCTSVQWVLLALDSPGLGSPSPRQLSCQTHVLGSEDLAVSQTSLVLVIPGCCLPATGQGQSVWSGGLPTELV